MNLLDIRTVLISYIISNAICAAVMATLWLQNRHRSPELGFWMADFLMQFTALLLVTMRNVLPDLISMVLSSALIVGGTMLLYIGLERYTRKTGPQLHNLLYLALFILIQINFVYIHPSLQARNINFSIGLLVICSQAAWLLLRRVDASMRQITRTAGLVFCIFVLVSIARIFFDLAAPPLEDFFKSGLYDTLVILTYQMLYISLTFSLFLMVNRRLFTELESDIQKRKVVEEAHRKSEEKFSLAFHNIPDALVITSLSDGKIIEANESFFSMSGFNKEEHPNKTTKELDFWGSLTHRRQLTDSLEEHGRVINFETDFRKKSGELIPCVISSELYQLQNQTCVLNIIHDNTRRKQAEDTLKKSERKFRLLFNEMLSGFALHEIICDHDGKPVDYRFLSVNGAFERMTGLNSADIIGKTVLEVLPDTEASWIERYGEVAITRKPLHFESYSSPLGKHFEVRAYSPEPGEFATVFTDITDRKRADDLLRKRLELLEYADSHTMEELLQKTLDELGELTGSPIGFFHFLNDDQQILILQAWSTLTKQEFCKAEGKGMHYIVSEAGIWANPVYDKAPVIHNDFALEPGRKGFPEGHASVERELVVPIMRGGKVVAILGVGNKPTLYTQEDVDLVSYFADVAWEKAKRKQNEEKLAQTLERLNLATHAARLGIWDWDIQKDELVWDKRMYELYGIREEDFSGAREAWLNGIHPNDRDRSFEISEQAQRGERDYDTEFRVIWKDGSIHHIKAEAQVIRAADGTPLRMTGINYDITERNKAEEILKSYSEHLQQEVEQRTSELHQAQEKLMRQERLAALGRMAGFISHELRNPIGVISNAVYFMKMAQPDLNNELNESLNIIEKEIHISEKIISDLLDFTRIKAMDRQPASVSELIGQTLERFPAPESVETVIEIPTNLPDIFVDHQQFSQVLGNIITNAHQAMLDGGKVTITATAQSDMIGIAIRDTGVGIPPENMDKLFEPLFTTKTKGIGLGLAICKMLVEVNDGQIDVQSYPGHGSTFTIYMPIYKERE